VACLAPLLSFFFLFQFLPQVLSGEQIVYSRPWIDLIGLRLSFLVDGYGLFFGLLVSGVGVLVFLYSIFYLSPNHDHVKYFSYLLFFMGAMMGVVLSDDILLIFVFWELTSVSSFLLIGFFHERPSARAAANRALVITAVGGLAFLTACVLIGLTAGTFSLSALRADPTALLSHPSASIIMGLLLLAIFTKSAQMPFHIWLPAAMEAPTSISCYLHAATMVKAGVYLLGRLWPIFGEWSLWENLLIGFGWSTMVYGAFMALRADDLKRILAYSTVSSLGGFVGLYGLAPSSGVDVYAIMAHACYKGSLFLVAGMIAHSTGTRLVSRLGGLRRSMPVTAFIAVLAAFSMGGIPPFAGFVVKEITYSAFLQHAGMGKWVFISFAVFANALTFAYALKILGVFFGKEKSDLPHPPHEVSPGMWIPAGLLAVFGLITGVACGPLSESFGKLSSASVHLHLSLWHGVSGALLLSLVTYGLGGLAFRYRAVLSQPTFPAFLPSTDHMYDRTISGLAQFAASLTQITQKGRLRHDIVRTILFVCVVGLASFFMGSTKQGVKLDLSQVRLPEVVMTLLLIVGAMCVVRAKTRLAAVLSLSSVGYGMAVTYVLYRSPDILLTQILIESVSLILFLLVFYRMPPFREDPTSLVRRRWEAIFSAFVGILFASLVYMCAVAPRSLELGQTYMAKSFPEAGGRNAVNVIIVDFRAFDTFGEITVLGIAAIGAWTLLRVRRRKDQGSGMESKI